MPKIVFPIGDNRNKQVAELSADYKFKLCPLPCKSFGVEVDEICKGGQEIDTSTEPTIDFWSNFSSQGSFKYLTDLEISPTIPTGVYTVKFANNYIFNLEGPVTIVNSPFYRKFDSFVRKSNGPYLPEWIMTFKRTGWGGEWITGDRIEFNVTRNHVGDATQTLVFDLCSISHTSKCGGNERRYQFCLCAKHKTAKCLCDYSVSDLHWYIVGTPPATLFDEDWGFTWLNPETCCLNWVELRGDYHGLLFKEYNGDIALTGTRFKPVSEQHIYPEDDERNFETVHPTWRETEGFECDRLRWKLGSNDYYSPYGHGSSWGLVPGEKISVNSDIEDENCPSIIELASIYVETVGLIGGYVQTVVEEFDSEGRAFNKYVVRIKGKDILLNSTDFTPYNVGDYVAVQKEGMVPPRGYPSVDRWIDEDNVWHDAVPNITDENVPKVDVDDGWIIFYSMNVLPTGYYGESYLGDPLLSKFDKRDLIGNNIKIIQGKGVEQERSVVSMRGIDSDKCNVDFPFNPVPNSTSKFHIVSSTVFGSDNLKIIPYDFKNGPTYSYVGP